MAAIRLAAGMIALGAALTGCAPTLLKPEPTLHNITDPQGGDRVTFDWKDHYSPSLSDIPPGDLVDGWSDEHGFVSQWRGLKHRHCGTPVEVVSSTGEVVHGRLLVMGHRENGRGPAGRGDYRVKVADRFIDQTSGGRTAVQYESYVADDTEYYAWILWMRQEPFFGPDHECNQDT
ncbi:MAG: hypothetical protein ACQEXJ_19635 [Myxococcota bacterium]